MQLQHQLTQTDAIIIGYAGNHGYNLIIQNQDANASLFGTSLTPQQNPAGAPFAGLPATQPDANFTQADTFQNTAISGYNGVSITYKHIDRRGLTADVTYTYSHALDDISNGGVGEYFNTGSIVSQVTPFGPSKLMYSNSDYDIRHNLVLDLTYAVPYHFHNKVVDLAAGGWTVASKAYWRSGEPFSVIDSQLSGAISPTIGGTTLAGVMPGFKVQHTCMSVSKPCFQTNPFYSPSTQPNFGNIPRNAFYGPHYADVDLSVYKQIIRA